MPTDALATRPTARAGQFYPADPARMNAAVDAYLAAGAGSSQGRITCRAVMLPHAGWVYCGEVIGRTLAAAEVPDLAIVVGPRHTPYGAPWSIAPQRAWAIPGDRVPIATEIAERLAALCPALVLEPEAHAVEHGTEVLLPFLRRVNPRVRVIPVVLGEMDFDAAAALGTALTAVVREAGGRALLVISSDMNHFAPEVENRRRDALALDALTTGDPRRLYDTVRAHDISMCGVIPAVAVLTALRRETPEVAPRVVHYTTSGEASGDLTRVVGYAGAVVP